jgi:energy-coupling factor transporter ATP-binding protein EcfA2
MTDMTSHYGLTREPFTKNLTTGMLHHHHGHDEAAARITWCIQEGAIAVITGESGAGKTAAARAAIAGIDRTRHHIIYIANPTTGIRGLWHSIVAATGGKPAMHNAVLAAQAEHALAAEAGERGRRPVLIVDEAPDVRPSSRDAPGKDARVRSRRCRLDSRPSRSWQAGGTERGPRSRAEESARRSRGAVNDRGRCPSGGRYRALRRHGPARRRGIRRGRFLAARRDSQPAGRRAACRPGAGSGPGRRHRTQAPPLLQTLEAVR